MEFEDFAGYDYEDSDVILDNGMSLMPRFEPEPNTERNRSGSNKRSTSNKRGGPA